MKLDWLRDKCISRLLIHAGYHPKDVKRLKLENLEDHPDHHDHDNCHKPIIKIRNIKTKEHWKTTRNVIACGCCGNHDEMNMDCEYSLFKLLLQNLPDDFAKKSLWWNTTGNKWNKTQGKDGMKQATIGAALERINKRE